MNLHLQQTINEYKSNGIDFLPFLTWHLEHGVVVCDNDSFVVCYYSIDSDPECAVVFDQCNTLFVTYCSGNMLKALTKFKDDFQFISFQRDFKNSSRVRVYSMDKFYNKLTRK
jgi:hypothetical protein